jgi:hypothetical protein
MLGDQRRGPGIAGEPGHAARPDGVTHADRRVDEVERPPGLVIHGRRRVLLRPAVVVLADGVKNGVPPRMGGQRGAVLHDPPRQLGMLGLRNQLDAAVEAANDHPAASK